MKCPLLRRAVVALAPLVLAAGGIGLGSDSRPQRRERVGIDWLIGRQMRGELIEQLVVPIRQLVGRGRIGKV